MTVIAAPSTFKPDSFSMYLATNERAFASPYEGSEQVLDMGNDRWKISLTLPRDRPEVAARNEAFLNALRGQTNTCYLWHMKQRVPLGTMRGAPLTNGAFAGTDSMIIGTTPGATLLAGDMLGVAGLLLQVRDDAVADGSGVMTVTFVNKFRKYINAGLPVIWDRPTAPFRKVSNASFQHFFGYAEGVSIDFVEAIS
ncbi:hypothetical protein [Variovorax sp. OV084]|jgi:hypothetical protein|uniref:hypothetical protein n=1 Tax=Variovorax sp. OV084 TaxID=1882777 RepID=UPI0008D5F34E|nr:hypothetical protein [Variovorax sp. OV084]SES76216.1 hypothetical protein SAMN05443580_101200 [Variovorax sp. OV084]